MNAEFFYWEPLGKLAFRYAGPPWVFARDPIRRDICFVLPATVGEGRYMPFLFEELEVYQRAVDLAERFTRLTESFPPRGHYHLVDQLRRASLSISLNIAEGNGRWHAKDRKNFFWIARGSVFECVPLVELCRREKLITDETAAELKTELEVLSKMLTALIKGMDKRGY
jgi:four helix bundle protein